MRHFSARHLAAALVVVVAACGGGSDATPTTPPVITPAVVSAVVMSSAGASLVPQQTYALSATARDATGSPLTGRSTSWQTSAPGVASVSADGLVTALARGSATITATIDSRTATAAIAVVDGGFIGAAGGTIVANNGLATLTIPAGALTTALPITVTATPNPPAAGDVIAGTSYELGPEGTTFAKPVTLDFKYPAVVAAADSAQLLYVIGRFTAGKWAPLSGSSVNWLTRTVTAQTSSFSAYAVQFGLFFAGIDVTPTSPSLLWGQSLSFTAKAYDQTLNPLSLAIQWSGATDLGITQAGTITPIRPGGPFLIFATATWWVKCNPRPCPLPNYFTSQGGDSVAFFRSGAAEVVVGLKPIASVAVSPAATSMNAGARTTLAAILRDGSGVTLPMDFRTVVWSTSNASVALVAQSGEVTGISPGTATITATSAGKSGSAQISVTPSLTPVASVLVTPTLSSIERGTTLALSAQGFDGANNVLNGRAVTWSTNNPAIATVSISGVVTGVSVGSTLIMATIGGVQGGASVAVTNPIALVVGTPSLGSDFSCLARTNNGVWCWGRGVNGVLGNGTTVTEQSSPVQVSGSAGYTAVFAGADAACALNAVGQAWCWGANAGGQLGDNTTTMKLLPTLVSGGQTFTRISMGQLHACALDGSGAAWCWGPNSRLGDPGTTANFLTPHAVVGAPSFTQIAAGFSNTCAITAAGAAWCWGFSPSGEAGMGGVLAGGDKIARPVVGGHAFKSISSNSGGHFCGVATTGEVWCWGANTFGQLGNGTTVSSSTPVQLSTSLKFIAVAASGSFTCGIVADGTAWCWGLNGLLGTGSGFGQPQQVPTPVAVLGGRVFTEIATGGAHTCARAVDGTWCWGSSGNGRLGNGVATSGVTQFLAPVKVVFP